MKLYLTIFLMSFSMVVADDALPATEKAAAKPSVSFLGKSYFLGDDITAGKTMIVNRYYREGESPNKYRSYLSQRFILTQDAAKTVAANMGKSFEKQGKVTLVDEVAPGYSGMVLAEGGEKVSYVTVFVYHQAKNGKGVFVKSWDIKAPGMAQEKVDGIAAKFQKSTLEALVKAVFPKVVFPKKAETKE